MRKILLSFLLLGGVLAFGQTPDCTFTASFTSATAQAPAISNKPTPAGGPLGCTSWVVNYWTTGSTGVSVKIEGAADPGTGNPPTSGFTALTATSNSANPATGTNQGGILACCDYYPWIRINPSTFTGTSRKMTVRVYGWRGTVNVAGTGGGGGSGITQLTQDVLAGPGSGSKAATVVGLETVPFCSGFSPTNGQVLQYTTGGSPNPCYAAASSGGISQTSGTTNQAGQACTYSSGTLQIYWYTTPASPALAPTAFVCDENNLWRFVTLQTGSGPFWMSGAAAPLSSGLASGRPACSSTSYYLATDTHALTGCDGTTWSGTLNPSGSYALIFDSTSGNMECYDSSGASCFAAGGLNQLTGDVTAGPGTGSQAATVVKINGSTPGGTCTSQFVSSLSSSAVPTCTSVTPALAGLGNVTNAAQLPLAGGTMTGPISLGTQSAGISLTATAGTGGVTAGYLAAKDTSNPTQYVLPASGTCGSGIAASTATVGNPFELKAVPGLVYSGVADNAWTAGHILIGGSTTPGRIADSGVTGITAVSGATCIVGIAMANASTGATGTFRYFGPGQFGASYYTNPFSGTAGNFVTLGVGGTSPADSGLSFTAATAYSVLGNPTASPASAAYTPAPIVTSLGLGTTGALFKVCSGSICSEYGAAGRYVTFGGISGNSFAGIAVGTSASGYQSEHLGMESDGTNDVIWPTSGALQISDGATHYCNASTPSNCRDIAARSFISKGLTPTTSGCGTTGSAMGGNQTGTFTAGATSCAVTLTLAASTSGWNCLLVDRSTATGVPLMNISGSSTTAVFPTFTAVSGDVIAYSCQGY